ncbi:MAG: chloride channel protein [Chryseobacterium sp.]|nr:MAG: chloride channel protein [Chryseobacterium sp.]
MDKKKIVRQSYFSLILFSVLVGMLSTFLANTLKTITENYEDRFLHKLNQWPALYLIAPAIGLTLIYVLRKYAFDNRQNKGIKEIYNTLENRRDELPTYKIISHYINGFLTVIYGGSTGIEVSTVVATATIGATAHRRGNVALKYKAELVAAGVAAGITALFGSPLAGIFFAMEVITRRFSKTILLSTVTAAAVSWLMIFFIEEDRLFDFEITEWHWNAAPYLLLLAVLSGAVAVYFTKAVLWVKKRAAAMKSVYVRVGAASLFIGVALFFFPQLYGDSYHSVRSLFASTSDHSFDVEFVLLLAALALLKPLAAAVTLGGGGDGGVFAPGMVAGAMLGVLVALTANHYMDAGLIVQNFIVIGMVAVLAGCIHGPLTAVALAYTFSGGPAILLPAVFTVLVAIGTARLLYPYTVYSYRSAVK